jgi:hypothetical protein
MKKIILIIASMLLGCESPVQYTYWVCNEYYTKDNNYSCSCRETTSVYPVLGSDTCKDAKNFQVKCFSTTNEIVNKSCYCYGEHYQEAERDCKDTDSYTCKVVTSCP